VPSKQRGARDIVLLPSRQNLRAGTPDLRIAVAEAVDVLRAEKVITPADDALIALALRYAERIEAAVDVLVEADDLFAAAVASGEHGLSARVDRLVRDIEVHELVKQLGSELQKTLESLGASPAARAKLNIKPAKTGSRLGQLREVGGT
jgi:hypothetical protein